MRTQSPIKNRLSTGDWIGGRRASYPTRWGEYVSQRLTYQSVGLGRSGMISDNVIVQRFGLGFEVKLVDMFHWEDSKRECMRADIVDMVRIFYDALGGRARYASQPKAVKDICRGLKQSLILRRFRTAGALRAHLEQMDWR